MMKTLTIATFFILGLFNNCHGVCSENTVNIIDTPAQTVDHSSWNVLLQKYVNENGMVNYKGFMSDSSKLTAYLEMLGEHPPVENWSKDKALAYWINAYNAFTIQLILRNYPVKSIKDIAGSIPFINTPWDIKFIHIGKETYDLNNLEHGIIRKEFDEEKIHFALVCAAMSCPPLRNEAYTAKKLDAQLQDQANKFFNQGSQNKIQPNQAQLSPLLKWYSGVFKDKAPSIIAYVNQYSKVKMNEEAEIDYQDYNWRLNEQK